MDRDKARAGLEKLDDGAGDHVTGSGPGKARKRDSEAGKPKTISQSRKREAANYLREISPTQMANVLGAPGLTHKQRTFAYNVALGATQADAYRTAYNTKAKPKTVGDNACRIAKDVRIQAEIQAYRLAAEAAKHRTPADLRNLVIQTLTQQIIDPETPPAIRTQAAKTLGMVTEVAAFTERKESVIHHSSDALKSQILQQIQALMQPQTVQGETIEHDAASLLDEINGKGDGESTAQEG